MAWSKWEVLIYLGKCNDVRDGPNQQIRDFLSEEARSLGFISARSLNEAESKGSKMATKRGLSGLIDVVQQESQSEE